MNYRYQPAGTHAVAIPFAVKASVVIDENKGVSFSLHNDERETELGHA